ncbi:MAG: hypothetical protein ACRDLM_09150 [Gaiellaceae bacterium]
MSKERDAVETFGEFTTPPAPACKTGYCPVPFRLHGTSLRLLISPRTHRILGAALSTRIAGAQAPEIARRSNRFLHIFPSRPEKVACLIPRGGHNAAAQTFRGRCTTEFVSFSPYNRKVVPVRFEERWRHGGGHVQRAAWIVTVRRRDGRVEATRVIGQPPQLWK